MLKKDTIEILIDNRNVRHYEDLGYPIPKYKNSRGKIVSIKGSKIVVNISDIPQKTIYITIEVICDYCGKSYFPNIANYHRGHKEISKDCCSDCIPLKTKEINLLKYNTNKLKEISKIKGFILGRHKNDGHIVYDTFISKNVIPMFNPEDYIGAFQDLPYVCLIHKDKGILYRTYDSIRNLNCVCKYCNIDKRNDEKRHTYEFAEQSFKNKNYLLLEEEYINCDTNMKYVCLKHKDYGVQKCTLFNALSYSDNCDLCEHEKLSGENHWNWQGGISSERDKIRHSKEYIEWRNAVFKRDNYTCQVCGKQGVILNAHHINNFSDYPELRFDMNNGITICEKHHLPGFKNSFHNIYTQFNNTKEQLKEYIQKYKLGEFNELRKIG